MLLKTGYYLAKTTILCLPLIGATGLLNPTVHARAPSVEVRLDRDVVSVGERFQITYIIRGAFSTIKPPQWDQTYLELLMGPVYSRSVQIIQGKITQHVEYSFVFRALRPGKTTIQGGAVHWKGGQLPLPAITVHIEETTPHSARHQTPTPQQQTNTTTAPPRDVFVQIESPSKTLYPGTPLPVRYVLYSRHPILNLNLSYAPDNSGFWMVGKPIVDSPRVEHTSIQGIPYYKVVLADYILVPRQPGTFHLDSIAIDVTLQVVRETVPSWLEDWMDDPFFGRILRGFRIPDVDWVTVHISSDVHRVVVNPFPKPLPDNFLGITVQGTLAFNATFSDTTVRAGEPFTYEIEIYGNAFLKGIHLPTPPFPEQWLVQGPEIVRDHLRRTANYIRAYRRYRWMITSPDSGQFHIPAWTCTYFDGRTRQYQQITIPPQTITVLPAQPSPTTAQTHAPTSPSTPQDTSSYATTYAHNLTKSLRSTLNQWLSTLKTWITRYPAPIALASAGILISALLLAWYRRRQPPWWQPSWQAVLHAYHNANTNTNHPEPYLQALHRFLWTVARSLLTQASTPHTIPDPTLPAANSLLSTTTPDYASLDSSGIRTRLIQNGILSEEQAHTWEKLIRTVEQALYAQPHNTQVDIHHLHQEVQAWWQSVKKQLRQNPKKKTTPANLS